jgi:hypothetical protein
MQPKKTAQILSPHEMTMNKSIALLSHLVGALLLKDASPIKVQPRYYIRKWMKNFSSAFSITPNKDYSIHYTPLMDRKMRK